MGLGAESKEGATAIGRREGEVVLLVEGGQRRAGRGIGQGRMKGRKLGQS